MATATILDPFTPPASAPQLVSILPVARLTKKSIAAARAYCTARERESKAREAKERAREVLSREIGTCGAAEGDGYRVSFAPAGKTTDWRGLALALGARPEHIERYTRDGSPRIDVREIE